MDKVERGGYSPGMLSRPQWIVALALLAFVFARLAGTHVHLCFDGSEPPLTTHTVDSGALGHHSGEPQTHDDVDVDPIDDVLAKTAKIDLPILALLLVGLLLLFAHDRVLPRTRQRIPPPHRPPRFLRPLLRAPPR
jgi:hypothetical protein